MKRILLSLVISLMVITGLAVSEIAAQQQPPDINVSLAFSGSLLPDRLLYRMGDRIQIVVTLQNTGGEEITSKGFSALPFHLFLTFTDPDGKGIIANELITETADDTPPPPIIPVADQLAQVEPVERLPGAWFLSTTLPNAHAYYTLSKAGNYSVKAIIHMRTYLGIDHTVDGADYSEISGHKWEGSFESKPVRFILLADADKDGYYYPEGFPGNPTDCDDNNPNIPGPVLVSPAKGATGVSNTPTFSWGASCPDSTYGIQVAKDLAFTQLVVNESGLTGTSYTVTTPLLSNTMYYWRVNATNAKGDIFWSEVWSFTTVAAAPAAPILASPDNNATGVSTTPTLSWNASIGATSYRLQVSTSQTKWTGSYLKVNQSGINGTSYTIPSGKLSNNMVYYWHVNATNAAGTSDWSTVWKFTTAKKTYVLTVKKAGTGSGTVTASPGDLSWTGNTGTATYTAGTKVTLTATATPNTGSTFTGWSAYCSGSGNCSVVISGSKCTVNMCGPCNATATFKKK